MGHFATYYPAMGQIASLIAASCFSVAALVLGILSYLTVRKSQKMTESQVVMNREMFAFSSSLMSRFVASNNLQAEIYCAEKEQREAVTGNEERRIEDANTVQEVIYIR